MTSSNISHRAWTLGEEVTLVRRRRERARTKIIARELNRTPTSVSGKIQELTERGRGLSHKAEELALLEKLLGELV